MTQGFDGAAKMLILATHLAASRLAMARPAWVDPVRAIDRMTVRQIEKVAPGKLPDRGGLWLHKREDGGAQWFLRVTVHGRRRETGLGGYQKGRTASASG